jgi:hypothetical protein
LTRGALLLALAVVVQVINLPQLVTGPLVNTILVVGAASLEWPVSCALAALTPLFAFWLGILRFPVLLPAVMAGNLALVVVWLATPLNKHLRFAPAAVAKFLVMSGGIYLVKSAGVTLPRPIWIAFTVTQLITALIGGLLADGILALPLTHSQHTKEDNTRA